MLLLLTTENAFVLGIILFVLIVIVRDSILMSKQKEEAERRHEEAEARFMAALQETERLEQEMYRHAHLRKVHKQQQDEILAKSKAIPKQRTKTLPKI